MIGTNAQLVFSGDCTSMSRKGNKITAKGRFGPALFDSSLPRMIRGQICSHLAGSNNDGSFLISAGCTLLKANFKFTGTVANPVSAGFPYLLKIAGLTGAGASSAAAIAANAIFLNYFSNGWVEWGAGASIQRRQIIGSNVPAAGVVFLTLHRFFKTLPTVNDQVTFYPGCDGVYTTCQAYDAGNNPTGKFNNYLNFGAEPFIPIGNPSLVGMPNLNVRGGKK